MKRIGLAVAVLVSLAGAASAESPAGLTASDYSATADRQSPTRRDDNATSTIINCSAPSALSPPEVNSTTTPSVVVTWSAPASWGTNATAGTASVYRSTTAVFPGGLPLASGLTSTSYIDTTGAPSTIYFYFVQARNNCRGKSLTAMTSDSPASPGVLFGAEATVGTLQGTVTAAGNPIAGASITAGAFPATTNGSGFYQLSAIDAGSYTVAASAPGYIGASAMGVVVNADTATVQNLSLTPLTPSACFTDTTASDFAGGTGLNVDLGASPGDVKLASIAGVEGQDQNSDPLSGLSVSNNLSATVWTGQTFRAGVTGYLTKLTVALGLASGTSGTCTVEIRNVNGINPGTSVLATSTLGPVTNVGTAAFYSTTFATPTVLVSGTSYSIVLRLSVGSTVFGVRGSNPGGSSLANGQLFTTTNSGTSWAPGTTDLAFISFVTPPPSFQASGSFSASRIAARLPAPPPTGPLCRGLPRRRP
jgi:hypothetical protein